MDVVHWLISASVQLQPQEVALILRCHFAKELFQ